MTEKKLQRKTPGGKTPQQMKRKRYAKPHLINYGKVEKLTQSAGTIIGDHGPRRRN